MLSTCRTAPCAVSKLLCFRCRPKSSQYVKGLVVGFTLSHKLVPCEIIKQLSSPDSWICGVCGCTRWVLISLDLNERIIKLLSTKPKLPVPYTVKQGAPIQLLTMYVVSYAHPPTSATVDYSDVQPRHDCVWWRTGCASLLCCVLCLKEKYFTLQPKNFLWLVT